MLLFITSRSVFRSQWQRYLRVLNVQTRSGSKLYRKKSPHRWVVFYCDNLVCPKPYTIIAPETKTTDPTERRIKKMSDSQEAENKMKLQLPHLKNPHKLKKTADDEKVDKNSGLGTCCRCRFNPFGW